MTKTYQWYYDGSAIGGATSKTHTLTSGQTDSNLIECRVDADFGTDEVAALAEFSSGGSGITVEGVTSQAIPSGTGTTNVTIPGTPAQNDIVEVIVANDDTLYSSTPISGYTLVTSSEDTKAALTPCMVMYKRMGGSPDSVVAVPEVSDNAQACIVRLIRGVDTTTAEDASATSWTEVGAGGGFDIASPAITTVTDGALVCSLTTYDDAIDATVSAYPSGYSNTVERSAGSIANSNATAATCSKIVATAGTETPGAYTWSSAAGDTKLGVTYAWRPA